MKVKTLKDYLLGLDESFDDFNVNMTKHETTEEGGVKRFVQPIHGAIARVETKEIFLLDKEGADFFDRVEKIVDEKLQPSQE